MFKLITSCPPNNANLIVGSTIYPSVDTADVNDISFNDMIEYCSNVCEMADAFLAKVQAAEDKAKENEEKERVLNEETLKLQTLKAEFEKQQTLLDVKRKELDEIVAQQDVVNKRVEANFATISDRIEMDVRGTIRWISKATLMKFPKCFFTAMVCLNPDHNGRYSIDR